MSKRAVRALVGAAAVAATIALLIERRRRRRRPCLLEHLNLNIPSEAAAREFYVAALGGVVQPVTTNWRQLHVNVGASQFHLLTSASRVDVPPPGEKVRVPQKWAGVIELLTTEELPAVLARVKATASGDAQPVEDDVFAAVYGLGSGHWPTSPTLSEDGLRLLCTCPWGNRYIIRQAQRRWGWGTGFVAAGGHPGGAGELVALPLLAHPVAIGCAHAIASFFERILGCEAWLETMKLPPGAEHSAPTNQPAHLKRDGSAAAALAAVVPFATGQELRFIETADAPSPRAYLQDEDVHGYHVAFYTASHEAYVSAFERAHAAGALYSNPRFEGGKPEFGNAMSRQVALACGQFRVRDLSHPESGELGLMMELEVRSPRHISCPLRS